MDWLVQLDERCFLAINSHGGAALDILFVAISQLGQGIALAALVLGPMALLDRRRLRAHLLPIVLSVGIGAIAVEGAKWAVDRDRPARHFSSRDHGGARARMPAAALYRRSFPSGHAQAAAGAATYVALLYPALTLPAAALALLICLSRVYLGVHFPLDVLAGAAVGVGFSVAGFMLRARSSPRPEDLGRG
jgi:undecaprenyl-diphosphatase